MTPEEIAEIRQDSKTICPTNISAVSWQAHARELLEHIDSQADEIKRLKDNHCKDCCCARSWEALGITEYSGRSIPEEITRLREQVIKNRDIATDLQYICDDQDKEIKRLEEGRASDARLYHMSLDNMAKSLMKQRTALKKLGEMVRSRGRALVEERARRVHPWSFPTRISSSSMDPIIIVRAQDEAKEEAREQLRAEGVIR